MRRAKNTFWILAIVSNLLILAIDISGHSSLKWTKYGDQTEDVEVVSNPKEPVPESGNRKRLVFEEEITIGESEGDENYMFGENVQVIADDKGCIYVTDWGRKRIQKYSPEGKYLLSIGRKGQGPGEFGNIFGLVHFKKGRPYAVVNIDGYKYIRRFRYEIKDY